MIPFEKALNIVLKSTPKPQVETVPLHNSLNRVLAENVYSDIDMPPFDRSAMDGFAINSKDTSKVFEIIEDIPAGYVPKKHIKFGQAARIMTGAMVPRGADRVVMVEDSQLTALRRDSGQDNTFGYSGPARRTADRFGLLHTRQERDILLHANPAAF
ncbi:MAG: hypothetical protein ABIB65_00845 [Candidatus Margulisiibacteriota bacterium]